MTPKSKYNCIKHMLKMSLCKFGIMCGLDLRDISVSTILSRKSRLSLQLFTSDSKVEFILNFAVTVSQMTLKCMHNCIKHSMLKISLCKLGIPYVLNLQDISQIESFCNIQVSLTKLSAIIESFP